MAKPLLVIFIGVPGSGKTYFATRLAREIGAVRFNSDGMRLAIFGSLEKIDKIYNSNNRFMLNTHTFGAMNYVTKQVISAGTSVIYEAIQRTRKDRREMERLADQCGAQLVLVSMQINSELAVQRVQERTAANDIRKFDEAKAREVVAHFRDNLEPLERTDYVVSIDGEAPFEEQFRSFEQQLASIIGTDTV